VFDWITWSVWLVGFVILVIWIVVPIREFAAMRRRVKAKDEPTSDKRSTP
jgi:hypothetical protein